MSKRVVLAFSGGLDTSYCVVELVRRGYEVHTAFVDTGGVDTQTRSQIADRATSLGATRHHELDAARALWDDVVVPLVFSHAKALDQYPLLCSDRYLIVERCLRLARELGTEQFAHGCTAMGNDQVRFDTSVRCLGDFEIIAPIRELQERGGAIRDYEIAMLREAGHEVSARTSRYSINENLLGVTISGSEVDRFEAPDSHTHQLCRPRAKWPDEALKLRVEFEQGVAVAVDGKRLAGPELLAELNRRCGAYGVGRHIYTGDVVIGLKGRILFECPGLEALQISHRALEDCVNTRWQNQFRSLIGQRWAELVYAGFFFEPHKRDLERYLASSQQRVSGSVTLYSEGGSLSATAIDSPYILQAEGATYAQEASWTPTEAAGFIKLNGLSSELWASLEPDDG